MVIFLGFLTFMALYSLMNVAVHGELRPFMAFCVYFFGSLVTLALATGTLLAWLSERGQL